MNSLSKLKPIVSNPGFRFLAAVLFLYLVWEIILRAWLLDSDFSYAITDLLGNSSTFFYSLAGYEAAWNYPALTIDNMNVLYISVSCNGLEFFGLFTCFVIAFPASIRSKVWFLPLGIAIIFILNLLRIQFLISNFYFFRSSFDFNHKYTFNVLVYGVTLLLWLFWAKKEIGKRAAPTA